MRKFYKTIITTLIIFGLISIIPKYAFAKMINSKDKTQLNVLNNKDYTKNSFVKKELYNGTQNNWSDEILNKIVSALKNTSSSVDLSKYNLDEENTDDLIYNAFNKDLIAFNCYSSIKIERIGNKQTGKVKKLQITYAESNEVFKKRYNELTTRVNNIVQIVNSYSFKTDLEKALFLHDYINKNTEFDNNRSIENNSKDMSNTAYGVLINHKGLSDGYSNAYKIIMDKLKIDCIQVSSYSNDNDFWNMIKIDNEWYHVDLLRDDINNEISHKNFLRNDSEIKELGHYGWYRNDGKIKKSNSMKYESWKIHDVNSEILYNNGSLYYWIKDGIYKSDINCKRNTLLKECKKCIYTIYKHNIYYSLEDINNSSLKINSIDLDGKNDKSIYILPSSAYKSLNYSIKNIEISNSGVLSIKMINSSGKVREIKKQLDDTVVNYSSDVDIKYSTHVENKGWLNEEYNGAISGTTGENLRLEAIKIQIPNNPNLSVSYSAHVQNIGWQKYVSDNNISGTIGNGLRLEAIKIKLTGVDSKKYDIYYRVHVQNIGWLGWAKNNEIAGTLGKGLRAEAIETLIVKKNSPKAPITNDVSYRFKNPTIQYETHIRNMGWQGYVSNGEISGTIGKKLRVEGIRINLIDNVLSGGINYSTYVENKGWQKYVSNNNISGSTGKGLQIENIKIKLTGEISKKFDIYYCTHVQDYGWLNWAKNDEESGTLNQGRRIEAIKIILVEKGGKAPNKIGTENRSSIK